MVPQPEGVAIVESKSEGSAAVAAPRLMTIQEYFRTPETLTPQELIFGVLRVADSPIPRHQQIIFQLSRRMGDHVDRHEMGTVWISPLDVILDYERHLVVQPDLFYISAERMPFVPDRIRLAPDLVVEVLSPKPRIGELDERLGWFATYGVTECWLIHQLQQRTEVLQFAEGTIASRESYGWEEPVRSTVLPEFRPVFYDVLGTGSMGRERRS
jgi:Uma2 family endonuclease